MSARPSAGAELIAALTALVPRRLLAKLDAEPRVADGWSWAEGENWTVTTPGGEVVALRAEGGRVRAIEDVRCSCLLSPKCFHAFAVVSVLPIGEAEAAGDSARSGPEVEPEARPAAALEVSQVEAARLAWRAGAETLAAGASAAGAVAQAGLLRAVHACRAEGLHRAARAGLRVVQSIRDLRAERPEFDLPSLAAGFADLLDTARALAADGAAADPERIGVARRTYATIGNTRLRGLFTEPVIAPGYAGVATYLADGEGCVWTIPEVLPAETERAVAAYDAPAGIGDASLPHRELCRAGLFVQGATGSADGRLGGGASVKAVRAGASSWGEAAGLWDEDLAKQVDRAFAGGAGDAAGLLFARGEVVGADGDGLVVAFEREGAAPVVARCVAPSDHALLAYRDNLRMLACAPGLRVDVVVRLLADSPRTAALLAIGQREEGDGDRPRLRLPSAWAGRCNVGLDRLVRSYFSSAESSPRTVRLGERVDPLEALRRRLPRLALGGRATIPTSALAAIEREAAHLERRMMPRGAAALRALAEAACAADRGVSGARRAGDASALAEAWLAACAYEREATRVLRRASWA